MKVGLRASEVGKRANRLRYDEDFLGSGFCC